MPQEWGHSPDKDDQMIRGTGMRGRNLAVHGGEEVI